MIRTLYKVTLFSFACCINRIAFGQYAHPFLVTLFLTDRCNSNCKNCWLDGTGLKGDIAKDVALSLCKTKTPVIIVTGGEPTLHSDFIEIVSELSKKSIVYVLTGDYLYKFPAFNGNVRFVIAFHPYQDHKTLHERKQLLKRISANNKVYANITIDTESLNMVNKDDLCYIAKHTSRIYINKYIVDSCFASNHDMIVMKRIAFSICSNLSIDVVYPRNRWRLTDMIYGVLSKALYGQPFFKCSAYPFRQMMTTEGNLQNCLRAKNK